MININITHVMCLLGRQTNIVICERSDDKSFQKGKPVKKKIGHCDYSKIAAPQPLCLVRI